ncbi:MAG: site-specific DNA-methyltransferase [Candidatus Thermoplasmatota archaeon]|nr:site-specific DNA-methyltransferase [Candidatus Thermoplasmatota archaeon]
MTKPISPREDLFKAVGSTVDTGLTAGMTSSKVSAEKPNIQGHRKYISRLPPAVKASGPGFESGILYLCDNLRIMSALPDNFIDLIYMDPPFFTGKDRRARSRIKEAEDSFEDKWGYDIEGYIKWLSPRLIQARRLLNSTGLIYLHLDWHAVHYAKVEMDRIFGYKRFINEIIWRYRTGGVSKNMFARKHDTILSYSKTRMYRIEPWKEKAYTKSRYRKAGKVNYGSGEAEFFRDSNGVYNYVNASDVWEIPYINSQAKERVGYPSQKPESLLERIISSSTHRGDIVADFFCGSGTTGVVAQKLGRRWILADQSINALEVARMRLRQITADNGNNHVNNEITIHRC